MLAGAQGFSYINISNSSGAFNTFSQAAPSLNNAGTVAFYGVLDTGTKGIYTGNGGAVSTVKDSSQYTDFQIPVINNAGTVLYGAFSGANLRLLQTTGASTIEISAPNFFSTPQMNGTGTVVYLATDPVQGYGIFASTGATIAHTQGAFASLGDPSINLGGTVAFGGTLDSGGGPMVFTVQGISTNVVIDGTGVFGGLDAIGINNTGTVAYHGNLSIGGEGIYTKTGATTKTISDTTGQFSAYGPASLNSSGKVAFFANLDAGGSGIYEGDGTSTSKVVKTGDSLFGSTVSSVFMGSTGINDNGDVAFWYKLANGQTGVGLATATPEPGTAVLLVMGALGLATRRRRQA